jgi:uncharacterized repeat protein (TIGR03803 family)
MKYARIARLAGVVAAGSGVGIATISCGGGSRSGSGAATSTPVSGNTAAALTVAVKWPQQRAASGAHLIPDAAGSILLQLTTQSGTSVASTCLMRPTSTGTPSFYTFANVPSGALVLTASAFPDDACSQAPAQAVGMTSVTVQAGGSSQNVAVTMVGTVASVSVSSSSQTVTIGGGSSTTLTASALDSAGETVLTAPGDWTWRCTPATAVSPSSGTGPTATITGAALGAVSCTFSLTQAAGAPAVTASPAAITVQPLPPPASQYTLTSLASFNGIDGLNPNYVLADGHGGFYGTTGGGGNGFTGALSSGGGTLFHWTPAAGLTTLVQFSGTNGADPDSLLLDGQGNLIGTTGSGGANNAGTIFEWSATSGLTTLASFNTTNGAGPRGALFSDGQGNIYGTTYAGGLNGQGAVYEYSAANGIVLLANFNGTNGMGPNGLIPDGQGNFFGTTFYGGNTYYNSPVNGGGCGSIFEFNIANGITSVASFTGTNGLWPSAGLIADGQGNFYGTTQFQGIQPPGSAYKNGTMFRWNASSGITTLASFDGPPGMSNVQCSLVTDGQGNFYGTTWWGPAAVPGLSEGAGTVFRWSAGTGVTILATFGGTDGSSPQCGLVADGQGNFFGSTAWGGTGWDLTAPQWTEAYGTIFELSPTVAQGAIRGKSAVTRPSIQR